MTDSTEIEPIEFTKGRPLTGAQRSAALRLLAKEENRLWNEYHEEFDLTRRFESQAREEWIAANPDFVAADKKAQAYIKRVNKHLDKLRADASKIRLKVPSMWAKSPGKVRLRDSGAHFYGFSVEVASSIGGGVTPWSERVQELHAEHRTRSSAAYQAIQTLIEQKHEDIDRAVLGTGYESLITLPTLDEVLDEASL